MAHRTFTTSLPARRLLLSTITLVILSVSVQAQSPKRLELTLLIPKTGLKQSDQFKLQVMLRNSGEQNLYLFGMLEWGYSASLMFHILDASGREIEPNFFPDSPPYSPPDDKSDFVKLQPDNFLGTSFFAPMKLMGLRKPGMYSVYVEYSCPFKSYEVTVSPFWGSEMGKLRSNVVHIRVLRS